MNHECIMFKFCTLCNQESCAVCQKCVCLQKCKICRIVGGDCVCPCCGDIFCLVHTMADEVGVELCIKCFNRVCDTCGYFNCKCGEKLYCDCNVRTIFMCGSCGDVPICKKCISEHAACPNCRQVSICRGKFPGHKCPNCYNIFMDLNPCTGKPKAELNLLTAILCIRKRLPKSIIIKILAETADYSMNSCVQENEK
jgi:hypothetical protein